MPIKQHIEREQEAFEKRLYIPEGWHPELPKDTLYGEEHYPESAYELSEEKIQDFLAQSLTRVTTAMMKEARKIVIEENYTLEEYLGHLEGKVTGFEIAQHTMKTRNNITKRLEDITPAPTSGEVTNK